MWILLIVFLATPEKAESKYLLEKYMSQHECEEMRLFVTKEMAISYPGDRDYKIVCEPQLSRT